MQEELKAEALPTWATRMYADAWGEARWKAEKQRLQYFAYRDNPVGFGHDLLGYRYTSDIQRVMESVIQSPVTEARSANATGKTHGAASIAVWFYLVYPKAQVYVTSAPPVETNLKKLLWAEIMEIVNQKPQLFEGEKITDLLVQRTKKIFLAGVTIPTTGTAEEREAKFSGKHAPNLLFIVDEGDAVPEEVYKGIESCMSGGNARLLILFNPRVKQGPIYTMESENQARVIHLSALNHPNVTTGEDIIPGAVSREITVRRIHNWTRPLVAGEEPKKNDVFEVPDFLVGSVANDLRGMPLPPLPAGKRVIKENAFFYMVLGLYPDQSENQLISPDDIDKARQRWDEYVAKHGELPPIPRGRLGLDVAELGNDFNVPIFRYKNFVPRIEKIWQGVDPMVTGDKAIKICEARNPDIVLVDGTAVGSSVAPQISRALRGLTAYSVKVAGKPSPVIKSPAEGDFFQLRDQIWWACREWLRNEEAMLPPEPMLLEELRTPTYRVDLRGRIHIMDKDTMREKLKRSPNYADALVLTFTPAERAKVVRLSGGR